MTIIKIDYDTEDPLCSLVNNLRLQAKEEVFKNLEVFNDSLSLRFFNSIGYKNIKERHLSTSQSEGTELSFKVPSHSSDKLCPKCHKESLLSNSQGKRYCEVIGCDYSETGITRL